MLDALAALCKAVLYGALLSCVGAVIAPITLRVDDTLSIHSARIVRRCCVALIGASLAGALILLLRLGGQFDGATLSAVFSSSTGAALFMQIAGSLLLLAPGDDAPARGPRITFAALLALSFAFSGHAAVVGPFEGLFVVVHVCAAAWWIGSLWLLRRACKQELPAKVALIQRFSKLATIVIGALLIAGFLLIYVLVPFADLPALSAYEQNLARKLFLVAVVLGLAAYNKFRLTPRIMAGDAAATHALRRAIDIELLIIAAVLAATAVMTTYTSPHE